MGEFFEDLKDIPQFDDDGRKHIYEIYSRFLELTNNKKWSMDVVYEYDYIIENKNINLPILSFRTKNTGIAMYITSGIHGEEPAGPNALAESIDAFKEFECRGIPMIIYPICNPIGYLKDWRYPNMRRREKDDNYKSEDNPEGRYTVADAGHMVAIPQRRPQCTTFYKVPINEDAGALTYHIIKNFEQYKPLAHFDLHEDDEINMPYLHAYWPYGQDFVAKDIVNVIKKHFHVEPYSETVLHEKIIDGVVNWKTDGLLGDLFFEQVLFIDCQWKINNPAKFITTIETPSMNRPLEKRTALYGEIIRKLPEYYEMLRKDANNEYYF